MEGNQTSIMTAIEQVNIGVERLTEAAASGLNDLPPPAIGLASPSTFVFPCSYLLSYYTNSFFQVGTSILDVTSPTRYILWERRVC